MSREWKPGDVAMVGVPKKTAPGGDINEEGWVEVRVVKTFGGAWLALEDVDYFWSDDYSFFNGEVRPLLVIDPEDREQVIRAAAAVSKAGSWVEVDDAQAGLRSLLTPPKPEEPMGLGAVVEDEEGIPWVRCENAELEPHWYARNRVRQWSDFAAVRVLSEGVATDV